MCMCTCTHAHAHMCMCNDILTKRAKNASSAPVPVSSDRAVCCFRAVLQSTLFSLKCKDQSVKYVLWKVCMCVHCVHCVECTVYNVYKTVSSECAHFAVFSVHYTVLLLEVCSVSSVCSVSTSAQCSLCDDGHGPRILACPAHNWAICPKTKKGLFINLQTGYQHPFLFNWFAQLNLLMVNRSLFSYLWKVS